MSYFRPSDPGVFGNSSLLRAEQTNISTTKPALIGKPEAPLTISTCVALERVPQIIWDTNRYYRDLGVEPTATRKELRVAYQRKNGQGNVRLTYVLKQLLNPEVRAEYDRTRLGDLFMDMYVQEMFERMAAADAAEARANGLSVSAEDVLKRWGLVVEDGDTPNESVLDREEQNRKARGLSDPASTVWPYRYYLWRTQYLDDGRLATWQEQVHEALKSRGVSEQFAVGLAGQTPMPFLVGKVGNRIVVFLNRDEQPSVAAAENVAARVVEALHIEREKTSA